MTPIDAAIGAIGGAEWQIGPLTGPATGATGGASFGGILGDKISELAAVQNEASVQATALATGEASDPTQVVMAVEKAQMEMQLATTLRNKGTEAIQELMRTQI